jgi:hypothetical protein
LFLNEAALVYCFDFTNEPAYTSGAVLQSVNITVDTPSVVSAGAGTVLTQVFTQLDQFLNVVGTVPIGGGATTTLTPLRKGESMVRCQGVFSDGQKPIVAARIVVK